jgi:hypothetical protein
MTAAPVNQNKFHISGNYGFVALNRTSIVCTLHASYDGSGDNDDYPEYGKSLFLNYFLHRHGEY